MKKIIFIFLFSVIGIAGFSQQIPNPNPSFTLLDIRFERLPPPYMRVKVWGCFSSDPMPAVYCWWKVNGSMKPPVLVKKANQPLGYFELYSGTDTYIVEAWITTGNVVERIYYEYPAMAFNFSNYKTDVR
jgi:hypothetical protein